MQEAKELTHGQMVTHVTPDCPAAKRLSRCPSSTSRRDGSNRRRAIGLSGSLPATAGRTTASSSRLLDDRERFMWSCRRRISLKESYLAPADVLRSAKDHRWIVPCTLRALVVAMSCVAASIQSRPKSHRLTGGEDMRVLGSLRRADSNRADDAPKLSILDCRDRVIRHRCRARSGTTVRALQRLTSGPRCRLCCPRSADRCSHQCFDSRGRSIAVRVTSSFVLSAAFASISVARRAGDVTRRETDDTEHKRGSAERQRISGADAEDP